MQAGCDYAVDIPPGRVGARGGGGHLYSSVVAAADLVWCRPWPQLPHPPHPTYLSCHHRCRCGCTAGPPRAGPLPLTILRGDKWPAGARGEVGLEQPAGGPVDVCSPLYRAGRSRQGLPHIPTGDSARQRYSLAAYSTAGVCITWPRGAHPPFAYCRTPFFCPSPPDPPLAVRATPSPDNPQLWGPTTPPPRPHTSPLPSLPPHRVALSPHCPVGDHRCCIWTHNGGSGSELPTFARGALPPPLASPTQAATGVHWAGRPPHWRLFSHPLLATTALAAAAHTPQAV